MKFHVLLVLFFALAFGTATFAADKPLVSVPEQLQKTSVTVKSEYAQGSGTLVTRLIGDETVTFVWTAGHVVDDLRTIRKVIDGEGNSKILVEFKDPEIVAERYQSGRRVGQQTLNCKVIKYSDVNYGEDLAVLMIRLRGAYPLGTSAKFHPDANYIPPIGADLSHCGSLLGQFGANSYTTGVLSQTGRLLQESGANKPVFDQVTAVAFPGSSGGGVYLKENGVYIGMLTQGVTALQGFNFIVPVRRIHLWAKVSDIEWALDPSVPMPSMAEIDAIPVEELGSIPAGFRNMGGGVYKKPVGSCGIDKWIIRMWTCPMHPQIRRPRPGKCSLCGMKLIPVTSSVDEAEDGLKSLIKVEKLLHIIMPKP